MKCLRLFLQLLLDYQRCKYNVKYDFEKLKAELDIYKHRSKLSLDKDHKNTV